jgi:hypothetical protein
MIKDLLNYNTPIPKGDRQKYGFDFGTSSEISGEEKGENGQYTIKLSHVNEKVLFSSSESS